MTADTPTKDDNGNESRISHPSSYHCIQCLARVPSLYRKFSAATTTTNIKLSVCHSCGLDVDPYVEREDFLVAMDLILLRQDAYRHLLLNYHFITFQSVLQNLTKAIQYLVAASILQSYLLWEAFRDDGYMTTGINDSTTSITRTASLQNILDEEEDNGTLVVLFHLFFQSLFRISSLGIVAYFSLRRSSMYHQTKTTGQFSRFDYLTKVYVAVVLPTSFSIVTILVLIWENTFTVRLLGSLLILTYQMVSIHTLAAVTSRRPISDTAVIFLFSLRWVRSVHGCGPQYLHQENWWQSLVSVFRMPFQ